MGTKLVTLEEILLVVFVGTKVEEVMFDEVVVLKDTVLLLLDDALVELTPPEVTVLIEVVLAAELVEMLEEVAVMGRFVAVDWLEDVVAEEVSEELRLIELAVELVEELAVGEVPSIQLQMSKSSETVKAWKGEVVLVLSLGSACMCQDLNVATDCLV